MKRLKLDESDEVVELTEIPEAPPNKTQGAKAAKDQKFAAINSARAAQGLAAAQNVKAQAMLLQARMALFSANVQEMDEDAQQFFKLAREEVLQSMRKGIKGADGEE